LERIKRWMLLLSQFERFLHRNVQPLFNPSLCWRKWWSRALLT
jgi:hypothetical protein